MLWYGQPCTDSRIGQFWCSSLLQLYHYCCSWHLWIVARGWNHFQSAHCHLLLHWGGYSILPCITRWWCFRFSRNLGCYHGFASLRQRLLVGCNCFLCSSLFLCNSHPFGSPGITVRAIFPQVLVIGHPIHCPSWVVMGGIALLNECQLPLHLVQLHHWCRHHQHQPFWKPNCYDCFSTSAGACACNTPPHCWNCQVGLFPLDHALCHWISLVLYYWRHCHIRIAINIWCIFIVGGVSTKIGYQRHCSVNGWPICTKIGAVD